MHSILKRLVVLTAAAAAAFSMAVAVRAPELLPEEERAPRAWAPAGQAAVPAARADWRLMLVNASHPLGDYTPQLANVQGLYRMDVRVVGPARQLIADARAQGIELLICSAYRPVETQTRNLNYKIESLMRAGYGEQQARAEALRLIAEPGASEHETGLAMDIVSPGYEGLEASFAHSPASKWLVEHAADYGFILRYPREKEPVTGITFEPWHYRYVGVEAARQIMSQGLCLEEYLCLRDNLENYQA